ncbi:hypothetical protein NUW58_g4331 [Xylaria curta]|uniref:Uncharacterized protein n=1 Tax=Xylaria curta TaxID=42375 RepID=A0ACC1P9F0_9PEZI|nr:hypothetical protein NUW58_g4331 [Xylaria curta]
MYAHSAVNFNTRQRYVDYIQEDCREGDPVKVLVSTIGVIGHGYNIYRANTVVITEAPQSSTKQSQAFGRVDRRGQVMTPQLIQLHDDMNMAEQVRKMRNDNRSQLSQVGPGDDFLARLVYDIDSEEDSDNGDGGDGESD